MEVQNAKIVLQCDVGHILTWDLSVPGYVTVSTVDGKRLYKMYELAEEGVDVSDPHLVLDFMYKLVINGDLLESV